MRLFLPKVLLVIVAFMVPSKAQVASSAVAGLFNLPISNIVLGMGVGAMKLSVAGRLLGILSDWFVNRGKNGVTVNTEIVSDSEDAENDSSAKDLTLPEVNKFQPQQQPTFTLQQLQTLLNQLQNSAPPTQFPNQPEGFQRRQGFLQDINGQDMNAFPQFAQPIQQQAPYPQFPAPQQMFGPNFRFGSGFFPQNNPSSVHPLQRQAPSTKGNDAAKLATSASFIPGSQIPAPRSAINSRPLNGGGNFIASGNNQFPFFGLTAPQQQKQNHMQFPQSGLPLSNPPPFIGSQMPFQRWNSQTQGDQFGRQNYNDHQAIVNQFFHPQPSSHQVMPPSQIRQSNSQPGMYTAPQRPKTIQPRLAVASADTGIASSDQHLPSSNQAPPYSEQSMPQWHSAMSNSQQVIPYPMRHSATNSSVTVSRDKEEVSTMDSVQQVPENNDESPKDHPIHRVSRRDADVGLTNETERKYRPDSSQLRP